MSSPSTPSQAAHPIARLCQRSGRGTGGHLVRFWAMLSPPHRHHIGTERPAAGQRLDGLTSCPPLPRPLPRPSLPSGGEGRAARLRACDPLQLTPSTLSALSGCLGICADTSGGRGGGRVDISGRRGSSARKFVSGFFARLYSSKFQLFNFSEGFSRAMQVHRGNGNCT